MPRPIRKHPYLRTLSVLWALPLLALCLVTGAATCTFDQSRALELRKCQNECVDKHNECMLMARSEEEIQSCKSDLGLCISSCEESANGSEYSQILQVPTGAHSLAAYRNLWPVEGQPP